MLSTYAMQLHRIPTGLYRQDTVLKVFQEIYWYILYRNSASSKKAFSAQRFYCSKAEYRLLATLCRVWTFTVLYHLHRTGAPPMLFILSQKTLVFTFYRLFFTGSLRSNRGAYMKLYTATDLSFKVTNHVAPPVN